MKFLEMSKAIVFGGAGFIGSFVCDELSRKGYEVTIFDIKPSPYLADGQEMIVGDILDEELVTNAISGHDYVLNFAGIADIDQCANQPLDAIRYNILGNAVILEACVKAGIKRYLFASSAYVYSNSGAIYKNTKQAAELFIETYHQRHQLPYAIIRYGSLYGPRSDARNSIYRIIKEALTEGKIHYKGTGEETREYIHVQDAAELTVRILEEDAFAQQHLVLTGSQSIKYRDLLDMIKEMLNHQVEIEYLPNTSKTHYKLTPYAFAPKLGRKLVNNPFIDMGQGLLQIMEHVHEEGDKF